MTTVDQLTQVFCDNFVAYTRSHIAHLNITGRNFFSDHKFLQEVYEDLQDEIDFSGELIRSLGEKVPAGLDEISMRSHIDTSEIAGDADTLLSDVRDDLEHLKSCYVELLTVAEDEKLEEIANHAQDRLLALEKFIWMLDSILS